MTFTTSSKFALRPSNIWPPTLMPTFWNTRLLTCWHGVTSKSDFSRPRVNEDKPSACNSRGEHSRWRSSSYHWRKNCESTVNTNALVIAKKRTSAHFPIAKRSFGLDFRLCQRNEKTRLPIINAVQFQSRLPEMEVCRPRHTWDLVFHTISQSRMGTSCPGTIKVDRLAGGRNISHCALQFSVCPLDKGGTQKTYAAHTRAFLHRNLICNIFPPARRHKTVIITIAFFVFAKSSPGKGTLLFNGKSNESGDLAEFGCQRGRCGLVPITFDVPGLPEDPWPSQPPFLDWLHYGTSRIAHFGEPWPLRFPSCGIWSPSETF